MTRYATIPKDMKNFLNKISGYFTGAREEKSLSDGLSDKKQEKLIALGREQFQKLLDKGLSLPVMTL